MVIAMKIRCPWAQGEANIRYHDAEWAVPQHDDRVLFEFLILEGAQAGLSWSTILLRRENYRQAFDGFDPARMANYRGARVEKLMKDPGIVRNRLKNHCGDTEREKLPCGTERVRHFRPVHLAVRGWSDAAERVAVSPAGSDPHCRG